MRPETEVTVGRTTVRRRVRGRWAVPVAAVIALGVMAPAVQADEPFAYDLDETSVRALDAAGNDVTQAGAHPDRLEIKFAITDAPTGFRGSPEPTALVKDVEVTLPEGLQGNPEAAPKCSMARFNQETCPSASHVGEHALVYNSGRGVAWDFPVITNLYNLEPPQGVVARFGMKVLPVPVVLDMKVKSDGSYAVVSNIRNVSQYLHLIRSTTTLYGVPAARNGSTSPHIPLLTLGSQCETVPQATIRVNSWIDPTT